MKTIGANLLAHLQGATTTLAYLWKVTRQDAQVFGFTSLDRDLLYAGVTYKANGAWSASNVAQDTRLSVGNLEITGYLSGDAITHADAEAGVWDHATVQLWRVNYTSLADGHEVVAVGELGEVRLSDGQMVVELRGFLQKLQNEQGRVFLPTCDAALGDSRCTIDVTGTGTLLTSGTVTSVTSRAVFSASGLSTGSGTADDYYRFGLVSWLTGANSGRRMEVKEYTGTGGVVELQLPMVSPIAGGDTFSVYPGCDKTAVTCKAKFSNLANFRGFPTIPGVSKLLSGGQ
jgi:uncharacterized phage protein (TIGR02218 family)